MTGTQNFTSNQFNNNIPIKGDTAFVEGFNVIPVMLDPNSVNQLVPGDAVVLTTTDGTTIMIDKAAADEVAFGFVLYNMQKNIFVPGDAFEVARFGTAVWAEAQGSIQRGDDLEYVPDTVNVGINDNPLIKVSAGVNPICGVALDNASDGDLFRFVIITEVDFTPVIVGGSINNTPIGQGTANVGKFTVLQATTSLSVSGSTISKTLADAIVALTPGTTISVDPTLGGLFTLVPGTSCTLNMASVNTKHQRIVLVITTSGSSSFTITFGTSFKSAGTLATGTASGKVFVVCFECDGVNWNEASRTTAL